MMPVLFFLGLGLIAGFLLRNREAVVRRIDRLVMAMIYLLLFLLGVSIGTNREILAKIGWIGLDAGLLTLAGLAGTVAVSAFIYHCFFKGEPLEE